MSSMTWHTVKARPDALLPEYLRTVGVDADGTFYLPAAIGGSEQKAMLCASYDHEPLALFRGHIYLGAEWLAHEYRSMADVVEVIVRRLREHIAKEACHG